jgi:hypothetical protein
MTTMNITIVNDETGQSESIPVTSNTSVKDLTEWALALLGIDDPVFLKHQSPINATDATVTLEAAGLQDGDLLMVVSNRRLRSTQRQNPPATAAAGLDLSGWLGATNSSGTQGGGAHSAAAAAGSGGLDFSHLLGPAAGATGTATATSTASTPNPVYYPGMSLHEAQSYNPHPHAFCQVLFDHEHLRKELNYYHPKLIAEMFPAAVAAAAATTTGNHHTSIVVKHAAKIWRETMIKVSRSPVYHHHVLFLLLLSVS